MIFVTRCRLVRTNLLSMGALAIAHELRAVSTQLPVLQTRDSGFNQKNVSNCQVAWHYQWPTMVMVGKATRG
jgi:hypothetical protein